jgi:alpha-D-ribose 1-methylphosphonate 5-triphosphate synthase subunit PhnG
LRPDPFPLTIEGVSLNDTNTTISQMDRRALARMLKTLSMLEIKILKGPEAGLLMVSVTDPFDTDFHLGEALVTEAIVEYGGVKGYGMVMGDEPDRAVASAAVGAIARAAPAGIPEVNRIMASEQKKIEKAREREEALVESTRVKFESMVRG